MDTPVLGAQLTPNVSRFQGLTGKLMANVDFCRALDDMAADVMELLDPRMAEQLPTLLDVGFEPADAELLIAMVIGWILGYHENRHESHEYRRAELRDRIITAVVAAGASAHVTSAMHQRGTN